MEWQDVTLLIGGSSAATLLGVIAKFLLGRKKQALEHKQAQEKIETDRIAAEFERLGNRITKLEADHAECMRNNAELARRAGESEGKIVGLTAIMEKLEHASRKDVADKTAEVAVQKVATAIEQAVEKKTQ